MPPGLPADGVDVTLDVEYEPDGSLAAVAKIQCEGYELNVRAPLADLEQLRGIRRASWQDRRSIRLGRCAGSDVFWCADAGGATILVGHDDETWDIAVTVPLKVVETIASFSGGPNSTTENNSSRDATTLQDSEEA